MESNESIEYRTYMTWNDQLEDTLKQLGEKAAGYSILHSKCEEMYSTRNTWLSIPAICVGSIIGAVSVGSTEIFGTGNYGSFVIGAASIFSSILGTINSYFGYSKKAENHRICSISYKKLYTMIMLELGIPRNQRSDAKQLFKYIKLENERLIEISPNIPDKIIKEFKDKYRDSYGVVSFPQEANGLDNITIHRGVDLTHSRSLRINSPQNISLDIKPINESTNL